MASLKISLDPSQIKDRWGLTALSLIVWLIIAYAVLTRPDLNIGITITVLTSTLILLLLVLMLSFKPDVRNLEKPPQNIPTEVPHNRQMPPHDDIALVMEAILTIRENPQVQQILKNRK